ncbi:MAG: hypothetical protein ACJA2N_001292 [Salibacteraceae bacterium]|jgi:hypothetical protein
MDIAVANDNVDKHNDRKNIIGTVRAFLGIYSGRIGADHGKAQLGIVFKKQVIDEIIEGNVNGTIEFQFK